MGEGAGRVQPRHADGWADVHRGWERPARAGRDDASHDDFMWQQQLQQGMPPQRPQGGPQQQMLFGQSMMTFPCQQPGGCMMMPQNAHGEQSPSMHMPGQRFNVGCDNLQRQTVMAPSIMAPGGQGFVPRQGGFMRQGVLPHPWRPKKLAAERVAAENAPAEKLAAERPAAKIHAIQNKTIKKPSE